MHQKGPLRDLVLYYPTLKSTPIQACHFHYPLPPSPRTLTAKWACGNKNVAYKEVLIRICKVVATSNNTDNAYSLTEVL